MNVLYGDKSVKETVLNEGEMVVPVEVGDVVAAGG